VPVGLSVAQLLPGIVSAAAPLHEPRAGELRERLVNSYEPDTQKLPKGGEIESRVRRKSRIFPAGPA
jgi:hypothetical protein